MSFSSFKSMGRTKSGHRRLIDALKAALRLKQQFPGDDIKVYATQAGARAVKTMY
jgi:hypothetical protein